MSTIDPRALRHAFGSYPTGVTVVTTIDGDGTPLGFTANSFASVSLNPPLLLVCPARSLTSFPVFERCSKFAVNVLAEGQEDISNIFASFKGDRFSKMPWRFDAAGRPLIEGAAATFSCTTHSTMEAGDHVVLMGLVKDFAQSGRRGLGYAAGAYFSLGLERRAADAPLPGRSALAGVIIEHDGSVLLEKTPDGWRPPQILLGANDRARPALGAHLDKKLPSAALGPVYSVFDDRECGQSFTFFHAKAGSAATGKLGKWVSLDHIDKAGFATSAIATMLQRYALEFKTHTFGLYVGDETAGDVHRIEEDRSL